MKIGCLDKGGLRGYQTKDWGLAEGMELSRVSLQNVIQDLVYNRS